MFIFFSTVFDRKINNQRTKVQNYVKISGEADVEDQLMGSRWKNIYGEYLKGGSKFSEEPPHHLKWHSSLLPANK